MALVPSERLERDPGLAVERTSLSWNRTALALLANGVLAVVHQERGLPQPVGFVLLVVSLVLAASTSGYAAVRGRHARLSRPRTSPHPAAVVGLGAALVLLCLGTALTLAVRVAS